MPLRLFTLNVEADRHLERIHAAISKHRPDIVCLQEVLEDDCRHLAALGPYHVQYATSARLAGVDGSLVGRNWGLAVLSRVSILSQKIVNYSHHTDVRVLREPNDPRRMVIETCVTCGGSVFRIATTHFTWSDRGQISDEQQTDFARLKAVLANYPHYVLCGDFNAPRGRTMFQRFTDELGLIDHLPRSVTTTIDAQLHRAGDLGIVVDTVFSTPHYFISNVEVVEGVSDHKGILADVDRVDDRGGRSLRR